MSLERQGNSENYEGDGEEGSDLSRVFARICLRCRQYWILGKRSGDLKGRRAGVYESESMASVYGFVDMCMYMCARVCVCVCVCFVRV